MSTATLTYVHDKSSSDTNASCLITLTDGTNVFIVALDGRWYFVLLHHELQQSLLTADLY